MAYKPEIREMVVPKPTLPEQKEMAKRFLQKNPTVKAAVLAEMFDLGERMAFRIIEANRVAMHKFDNIEDQIDGLPWQYNPEKEIEGIEIPRYN